MTNYFRRFGIEIELNSFDGLDRPIGHEYGKLPTGIEYIANLVKQNSIDNVNIYKHTYNHNNNEWVLKPDGSCGIEVCSPVLKGNLGLNNIFNVIKSFSNDKKIKADERCSLHVHVNISDLDQRQISNIINWWIKCEPVFIDSMPLNRKNNQYCQFIGFSNLISDIEYTPYSSDVIIKKLGVNKYYSINCYHYYYQKRKTLEFRLMDNKACLNQEDATNWIFLLIHFVECTLKLDYISRYNHNDILSGYCWLDPIKVFEILNFNSNNINKELINLRSWFIKRLIKNSKEFNEKGIFSKQARLNSLKEIKKLSELL